MPATASGYSAATGPLANAIRAPTLIPSIQRVARGIGFPVPIVIAVSRALLMR